MNYKLDPHIVGDTWEGLGSLTFTRNGSAINLTNASVVMEVRKAFLVATPVVLRLSTEDNSIVITAPLSGILAVPARKIDIPVGMYEWSMTLNLASGETKTYMMGSWPIVPKIPLYTNQNVYDHFQIIE